MEYKQLTVGGTFDHLHRGHEAILREAFRLADEVIVAITADEMVYGKVLARVIEPFPEREKALQRFLQKEGVSQRVRIIRLHDIYGSSRTHPQLQAILVTSQTIGNARQINTERKKRGFPALKIITFPLVRGTDQKAISSTAIRSGWEDREGRAFAGKVLGLSGRFITDTMRPGLRFPLGDFVRGSSSNLGLAAKAVITLREWKEATCAIVVGDAATASIVARGGRPDLAVVDFRIRRKRVYDSISDLGFPKTTKTTVIRNPRGMVSRGLFTALQKYFHTMIQAPVITTSTTILQVLGEEDLATLPAVLLAPLGSVVVYGQPPIANGETKEGLVVVAVTEKIKNQVLELLAAFKR